LKNKRLVTIIKGLSELMDRPDYVKPRVYLADNEFNKKDFKDFVKSKGMTLINSIPSRP